MSLRVHMITLRPLDSVSGWNSLPAASPVAVGNAYFEGGFDKAAPEVVQKAWDDSERALEYLVNILRNDAYIDTSDTLNTPYVLVPMVVYLARRGGLFKDDKEKRGLLYWMYLALMWVGTLEALILAFRPMLIRLRART